MPGRSHQPAATPFERSFMWTAAAEGGYVNDPKDPGGPTKHGVSWRAVRLRDADRDGHLDFDLDGDGDVDEHDMRDITLDHARELYRADYWRACRCDDLPEVWALLVADAAFHQGPRTAVALLQRTLGVRADGRLGPVTLAALGRHGQGPAKIDRFMAERLERFRHAPSVDSHFRGWAMRVLRLTRYAHELIQEVAT